jgi:hypothetical protein
MGRNNKYKLMTRLTMLLCLNGLLLFSTSCRDCVKGSGNVISMDRPLPGFHSIRLKGSYHAYLINDSNSFVTLSTDDNILPDIRTEVYNGVLEIGEADGKCLRDIHRADVHIHTPAVSSITLEGSGNISSQHKLYGDVCTIMIKGSGNAGMEYEGNSVRGVIDGSGDIHLAGSAKNGTYEINGSGYVHGENMSLQEAAARISGSGMVETSVSTALQVNISGSGTVWYRGDPSLRVASSGSGKVKKR